MLAYRRLPLNGQSMNREMPKSEISVLVKQTIYIRDGVEWTFHKCLPFPAEVGHLVKLKDRARVHRASFNVVLTSEATGEILEGEAAISLTPKKRKFDKAAAGPPKKRGRPSKAEKASKPGNRAGKEATPGPSKATVPTTTSPSYTRRISVGQATNSDRAEIVEAPGEKDSDLNGDDRLRRGETLKSSASKRAAIQPVMKRGEI